MGLKIISLSIFAISVACFTLGADMANGQICGVPGTPACQTPHREKPKIRHEPVSKPKPKDAGFYFKRGKDRGGNKDYVGAIADFTRAIELDPKDPKAYISRGLIRGIRRQDYDGAIADLTTGIELDPKLKDVKDVYFVRGICGYLNRDWDVAYRDVAKFLELSGIGGDTNPYVLIFGYLALRNVPKTIVANTFLDTWLKQAVADAWETQILKYFAGRMTAAQLIALAADNNEKLTVAHTYIGELQLLEADRSAAFSHFVWVKNFGNMESVEYLLSLAELKRLGGGS